MTLPSIKTERLYQKIANLIIASIDEGMFKPGKALPAERELAKQLGVSRASLREALVVLEISGRIEIRSGNGVYVAEKKDKGNTFDVWELIQAREYIESQLAFLAAKNASPQQRDELCNLVKKMNDNIALSNVGEFYKNDKQFHLLIAKMTGNSIFVEISEMLWNKRINLPYADLDEHNGEHMKIKEFNQQHDAIAQAIIKGNSEGAKDLLIKHIELVNAVTSQATL